MLSVFAAYLSAHFFLYAVFLRHTAALRSEKGIFLYHFSSAALAVLAAVVCAVLDPSGFGIAGCVLVLSVHGIYSLSFLELWSLAQGGYSLSILGSVERASDEAQPDFSLLEQIGATKQRERIAGLEHLGLIAQHDGDLVLTARGQTAATLLYHLSKWVDPGQNRNKR